MPKRQIFTAQAPLVLVLLLVLTSAAQAGEKGGHTHRMGVQTHREQKGPVKMTMEELHRHGGVPSGWKFTLPAGDPAAGRVVFIAMKCYTCHKVAGERFPAHERDVGGTGPDLTGMGPHHPAEYFAQTIIHPNAVIVLGKGYTGPDGLSRMPEYNQTLSVAQLIDLVAYLKSLRAPASHPGMATPGQTRTIAIQNRRITGGRGVVRVTQGDTVTLRWSTDETVTLHLHGYDIETVVTPGTPAVFHFKAYAAGRFPITAHGFGTEHREKTLGYLEVVPR